MSTATCNELGGRAKQIFDILRRRAAGKFELANRFGDYTSRISEVRAFLSNSDEWQGWAIECVRGEYRLVQRYAA